MIPARKKGEAAAPAARGNTEPPQRQALAVCVLSRLMTISSDYSAPVRVNGFACRNCAEVDQAKHNIDPANPAAGPFGLNDPAQTKKNHFSAEARQQDLMEEKHRSQNKHGIAVSAASAAYRGAEGHAPGSFVNLSA